MADIDYSELRGRKVECLPGCGMCCLCQPEVLAGETAFFKKLHPASLIHSKTDDRYALALKKGRGSCVLLNDRKCGVYADRPTYCRQYPFHFHVGERIKIELDLSCRGVWTGNGTDATEYVMPMVRSADRRLMETLAEASSVYREFYGNCKDAGVMGDVRAMRSALSENLEHFTDLAYLGRVMETSAEEPFMSLGRMPDASIDIADVEDAARETSLDSMRSRDPFSVPVYCDGEFRWNLFMCSGDRIEWKVLDDGGDIADRGKANAKDIPLLPPENGGAAVLRDYIRILNQRDSMLGSVFCSMDEYGYEDSMENAYYGAMAVSVIDVMWRSSMLSYFMNTGTDASGMKEAIMFYDMDRLDAPGIGAFV